MQGQELAQTEDAAVCSEVHRYVLQPCCYGAVLTALPHSRQIASRVHIMRLQSLQA
jgi:hypothetical protein